MKVDYLIQKGHVIDDYQGIDDVRDIAVRNGKIVSADAAEPVYTIDASGCIVTPGFIDYHCHVGIRISDLGVDGETTYFPTGVTTVVDAGTSGTANYEAFRQETVHSRLRVKAYLNVCPAGLVTTGYHENINPAVFQRDKILRYLEKYSDQLLGLKVRQSAELTEGRGLEPMKAMLEIAEEAGCPVVVHTTNPPARPEELARLLRKGDVYAHVYQGKGETVIRDGHVIPEMFDHQKRGVIFDAANGVNHFSFDVAMKCLEEGFIPDIISTDLSSKSVFIPGKVFSLSAVLSKYLALGMPLSDVLRCAIRNPARALGQEELGSLCEGTSADIAIHRLVDRPTIFTDTFGKQVKGKQLLRTELTMKEGSVVFRQIDF